MVAEISWFSVAWGWNRGYVYAGSQLLAVQQDGVVRWVHEDPITKTKRMTDSSGAPISTIVFDPWGGAIGSPWSQNTAQQRRRFTTYERDGNESDEAMMRRYNRWHSRFDQPDPYEGSYSLTDPQSFNRHAYVQNDPVNFVDPTGLVSSGEGGGVDPTKTHTGGFFGGFFGGGFGVLDWSVTRTVPIPWLDNMRITFTINYTLLILGGGGNLQNPSPTQRPLTPMEIYRLRRDLKEMLAKPVCNNFIKGVLEELGNLPKGLSSTDLMTIFNAVRAAPNGGLFSDPSILSHALANAFGSLTSGDAQIAFGAAPTAAVAAHEIMHVAARSGYGYGHIEMAQAAHNSAGAMGLTVLEKFPKAGDYKTWKDFDSASCERLDNFVNDMPKGIEQIYIIVYAGRRAHVGEARARAERIKDYLVKERRVDKEWIVTIDGGYREHLTVELFGKLKGGAIPTPSPTVCPSEVEFKAGSKATH